MLMLLSFLTTSVAGYTIGNGGSAWDGNVSLTNTTIARSTGNVELRWIVNDYISRWRMDAGSGTLIRDENVASGNDCTLYDITWNPDGGIDFDSNGDYASCGGNNLANMKAFTYVADIKPSISDATPRYIMGIQGTGSNWYKSLYIQDTWSIRQNIKGSASNTRRYSADNALTQGVRKNVISTWSGGTSGAGISMYVNNVETPYSSTVNGDSVADDSGSTFVLGNRLDLTRPYRGTMYEAIVFDRVLSADERNKVYNKIKYSTGSITTWHDAGTGNEIYKIGVSAITPANTDYTVWYRQNGTGGFIQVGGVYTGNNTIALGSRYRNTDVRIALNGNQKATPELISITFYTQAESGESNPPSITSWGNSKTNNDALSLSINVGEMVNFNAAADQSIATWKWYKNDINQNNNYDNLSTSWDTAGIKTIKVNATNENGTSNTITWMVFIDEPGGYIIGNGGSAWDGNVLLTNTTIARSTGNVELHLIVNDYISRWRMDAGSGTLIRDENVASGNDCTLYDITWNPDGGIDFDSNGDYASCGGNNLANMKAFTYVADIKPSISDATPRYIMGIQETGSNWYKSLYIQDTWSIRQNIKGSASNTRRYSANNALAQGVRKNIISTWSGGTSGTGISVYVNNVETPYSSTANGDSVADDAGSTFVLGNRLDLTRPYRGTMYEAIVFDRVLSADERSKVYNKIKYSTGSITAWHDAGTGNEIYKIGVSAITPANTDYTVWYRQNGTGGFIQVGGVYTGNNTIALGSRYRNTDVRIALNGNQKATPELISITFYTQAESGESNPPSITSWGNSKTNNDALSLSINVGEMVNFNAAADQSIATWKWYKNDINQNNNYDNLSTSWDTAGIKTIKVNATNENGTSNTITWNIIVKNTPVILPKLSKTAPYSDIPVQGIANWGGKDREFIQAGHNDRIRQNGTIYQIRFAVADASRLTQFNFTIWRKNGNNYDRIATTDNLISNISNGINVINLSHPIEGVQEGDFYGYRIKASADALYVDTGVTNHLTYYVNGSVPSIINYNWIANAFSQYVFVIEPYMDNPSMVFIGDSIIAGHGKDEHYSFIETKDVTNIPGTIENQWARKVNRTYQNMGINGQRTSQLNYRFNSDAVNLSPEFVLIEGGVNDVSSGVGNTTILANWESMIQKAYNNDVTPVIMLILPWTDGSDAKLSKITYINEQLMGMAVKYSPSVVVDARCYIGVERPSGPTGNCWDINASYTVDGLHYNSIGTEKIAQAIKDSFKFVHGKQGLYNLIQPDGTIIYSTGLSNAVNTSWRMASTAGTANISYNIPSPGEVANITINSGTVDWFNIGNLYSNPICDLYSNSARVERSEAVYGHVNFTTDISSGTYYVQCTSSPNIGSPKIISWSNNKTNNDGLTVTINTSETVNFNVTADQNIDAWKWFKDGIDQNNNIYNYSTSWDIEGTKTISVNATNKNGTSNTITWTVFVNEPDKYTIGSGGSAWNGNVSLTNTTVVRSTENVELHWVVNDYISRWRMDAGSGTLIRDENVASGNDCTLYDITWNPDGGIDFDSNGDYASCGGNNLANMKAFTYVADLRPSTSDATPRYIMGIQGTGSNWYKSLYIQDIWSIRQNIKGSASNTRRYSADNALTQGVRKNVISTWSGGTSGAGISMYVNNVETPYSSTVNGDSVADDSGSTFVLGNRLDLTRPYRGTMYEAVVFDRVLSVDERSKVYNKIKYSTGSITAWHDAGTGNEIYKIGVSAITPANTNYTVWYRQNGTGGFVQVGGVYTGSSTIALGPRYRNTDVRIALNGNQKATPELISIMFYTQRVS
ncbi:MAG: GDSL-type esterase/lipase family protein [Candidatus Methanoperedens sp.]|nr:GDSL-type esterase/lipase family protein [Candidatus Methanoperedens sp.]